MASKSGDARAVKPPTGSPEPAAAAVQEAMPSWQNITDPIFYWAARRPDAPAFIQGPETVTYGELAPLVGKAAVYLDSIGIRGGDRVAINLTNSIDHFILMLGLLRLGATTMVIPYHAQKPPDSAQLAKLAMRAVFIESATAPVAGIQSIKVDGGWRSTIARSHGDRRSNDNGDGIFILFTTSGTTGPPKVSSRPHRQYFQALVADQELFADSGVLSDAHPANLLLGASIGVSGHFRRMVTFLFVGAPITILPEFANTIDLVRAIGAWDNAFCYVSAAVCRVLISAAPQQGVLFPRLRALVATGSFLYPEEKLAMLDRVCPNFYEAYGNAGFGRVAMLSPQAMRERPGSVGRPPSFVEVQVVDESGQPVPPKTFGRLRCRGIAGTAFADIDPASEERFHGEWYYPGDFAHLDDAGYIFLKGRSADVITRNGIEIFSAEIEAAIAQHPSVGEVAVVGVPRAATGVLPEDELVALVVPRGQPQHQALAQHCQARLPAPHWPDSVFYTQALPKTAAGKLDRARVKAIIMDEIMRRGRAQQRSA
jgi:acyl-coenzyme A synthetase/AMP-(fatty) acid ligase